jgi:glutamate racemase
MDASPAAVRVGVFDSGVGGLSVLRALRAHLPAAHLIYVADSAYAPYGERADAEIIARTEKISDFLRGQGVQVWVIACNTATAAAVQHLRQMHPEWPIVGVEPGLKPAVHLTRNGRIGVMATTSTLRSAKFQRLMAQHGGDVEVHLQACPGLAHAIEGGNLQSTELHELIERYGAALRARGVDTVVLGCTHYPFVRPQLQASLGAEVQIIDTAEPVARQAVKLVEALIGAGQIRPDSSHQADTDLWTTGDPVALAAIANAWLDFDCSIHTLDLP